MLIQRTWDGRGVGLRREHAKSLQNGAAVAAIQTILTRVHMNPIRQIRVHRRVVKTPMTPAKSIRNGFQDATEILVKYRCSAVKKRRSNARYDLAYTDDPNGKGVEKLAYQLFNFGANNLRGKVRKVIRTDFQNNNVGGQRGNHAKIAA